MKDYHIFLIATENYEKILKLLFLTLKQFKKDNSNYIIHLYIESQRILYFQESFKNLQNDNFKIEVKSCLPYKCLFDCNTIEGFADFFKLLTPKLFPNIDKILILDCDLFILQPGLEDFMDEDITDYYISAMLDAAITYNIDPSSMGWKEREQCQTKQYVNLGILELNLKKIREDGLDTQLLKAIIKFPDNLKSYYFAQTLSNYYFRNKIKICDSKFNNILLTSYGNDVRIIVEYLKNCGYKSVEDFINKTVVVHFAGPKPWKKNNFPGHLYFHFAEEIYNNIKNKFKEIDY